MSFTSKKKKCCFLKPVQIGALCHWSGIFIFWGLGTFLNETIDCTFYVRMF